MVGDGGRGGDTGKTQTPLWYRPTGLARAKVGMLWKATLGRVVAVIGNRGLGAGEGGQQARGATWGVWGPGSPAGGLAEARFRPPRQQELLFHFLQLMAAVEHYQQKFRSQASVIDEIVDTTFEVNQAGPEGRAGAGGHWKTR